MMMIYQDDVREITDDDLLTWELQLKREGTLPPEVQDRVLRALSDITKEHDFDH